MICLVNPPFASLHHPSLALGLIAGELRRARIPCRVFHLPFSLATRMQTERYEHLAARSACGAHIGEWLFAPTAWPASRFPPPEDFLARWMPAADRQLGLSDGAGWLGRLREQGIPEWLERVTDEILALEPRAVGFTAMYHQTLATIALARTLRRRRPDLPLIAGGPAFHGAAGNCLLQHVNALDWVVDGEGETLFLPVFSALEQGREVPEMPGLRRRSAVPAAPAPLTPGESMDCAADPDYSDFFQEGLSHGRWAGNVPPAQTYLPFEMSRGCWKGQSQHCAFCGFHGRQLEARSRSGRRVHEAMLNLSRNYPVRRLVAADTLLPRNVFEELLPHLEKEPLARDVEIFCEVRPTLTDREIARLANCGIRHLQPGIESLNTSLLRKMRKGLRTIDNVRFLRSCRRHGIYVSWNLLCAIPGERAEDYQAMARLIPWLIHLHPPAGELRPVELQPHSPWFAERHQLAEKVTPQEWYHHLYPGNLPLDDVAWYFHAQWRDVLPAGSREVCRDAVSLWRQIWVQSPELPDLVAVPREDGSLRIRDTRQPGRPGSWELDPRESRIYQAIDQGGNLADVEQALRTEGFDTGGARAVLDGFTRQGLALHEDSRWLALALPPGCPPPRRFPSWEATAAPEPEAMQGMEPA